MIWTGWLTDWAVFLWNKVYQADRAHTYLAPSPSRLELLKKRSPNQFISDESQDANRTEVAIVAALLTALDDPQPTDTGIVTPHNAQKGRLNQQFSETATIDAVERFQGGERDVIAISATASDPDYVRSEAEFLLNQTS